MPKAIKTLKTGTPAEVAIEKIVVSPHNPRSAAGDDELGRLGESLEREGLLHCPIVRPLGDGRLELVAGRRRYEAARAGGYQRLPVVILELDNRQSIIIAAQENFQRKNLSPLEEAAALASLTKPVAAGGAGLTNDEAAEVTGRAATTIIAYRRLLNLPEVWRSHLERGTISAQQAIDLGPYHDHPEVLAAIEAEFAADPDAWQSKGAFRENTRRVAEESGGLRRDTKGRRTIFSRQQIAAARGKTAQSRGAIADYFGVSKKTVWTWSKQGAPIIVGQDNDLAAIAQWVTARSKAEAPTDTAAAIDTAGVGRPAKKRERLGPRRSSPPRAGKLTYGEVVAMFLPYAASKPDLLLISEHVNSLLADLDR